VLVLRLRRKQLAGNSEFNLFVVCVFCDQCHLVHCQAQEDIEKKRGCSGKYLGLSEIEAHLLQIQVVFQIRAMHVLLNDQWCAEVLHTSTKKPDDIGMGLHASKNGKLNQHSLILE
jgi:hypothetical protein